MNGRTKCEAALEDFLRYRHCGLNADWCVSAWHLSCGTANTVSGDRYLLDNEDGSYEVVRRFYGEDGEDTIIRDHLFHSAALALAFVEGYIHG